MTTRRGRYGTELSEIEVLIANESDPEVLVWLSRQLRVVQDNAQKKRDELRKQ